MDEPLKIIIKTILEADEEASARRIRAQLPRIQELLKGDAIKVPAEIDTNNIRASATRVSKEIGQRITPVNIRVKTDESSFDRVRNTLRGLNVDPKIAEKFVDALSKYGVVVNSAAASWKAVEGTQQRLVQLSSECVDADKNRVSYIQTYNTESGELETIVRRVTAEYEKQDNLQKSIAKRIAQENDQRAAFLLSQESALDKIFNTHLGGNASAPLTKSANIETANQQYEDVLTMITRIRDEQGQLSKEQQASVKAMVSALESYIKSSLAAEKADASRAERDRANNEKRIAFLDMQEQQIKQLQQQYMHPDSSGYLGDDALRNDFNIASENALGEIAKLRNATGELTATQQANIRVQIAGLRDTGKLYGDIARESEAESKRETKALDDRTAAATRLEEQLKRVNERYRGESAIKRISEQGEDSDYAKMYSSIEAEINKVRDGTVKLTKSVEANISSMISQFDRLGKGIQNSEYVATSLRTRTVANVKSDELTNLNKYEEELKNAGLLTEQFKTKIAELRGSLNEAFDRNTLTAYLDSFDGLKSSVDAYKSRIASADEIYKKMISEEREIFRLEKQMATTADGAKLVALNDELNYHKRIKAELERQAAAYSDVVVHSKQAAEHTKILSDISLKKNTFEGGQYDDYAAEISRYEEELRNAGLLTEQFEQDIAELRAELNRAFSGNDMASFAAQMERFKQSAAGIKVQSIDLDTLYDDLIKTEKKLFDLQKQLTMADGESQRAEIQAQINAHEGRAKAIESQIAMYGELGTQVAGYAKHLQEAAAIENSRRMFDAGLADQAAEIDKAMLTIDSRIASVDAKFRQLNNPSENLIQNMRDLRNLADSWDANMSNSDKVLYYQRLQDAITNCTRQITGFHTAEINGLRESRFSANLDKAKADLETVGRKWSALKKDPGLNAQFEELQRNLNNVNNSADLSKWRAEFNSFKAQVQAAGKNVESLFDTISNNLSKVTQWASATTILYKSFDLFKRAINTVIELDTALIDLKKTTDETNATYREFYYSANETAKALGVTTKAVIEQTAEWSRLGLTLKEAAKAAETSSIFAAISPEMDTAQATEGLISIWKAFGYEIDELLDDVASKVNKLGNEFAVTNADIVDIMQHSASSMAAARNSFEQTAALGVAAQEIVRSSSVVGNALKTISMRVRGLDEDTEEVSEDLVNISGALADLTKTASNTRGVSLFEPGDVDTYRSTYDILKDISYIWDDLTDKNRAELLELLFGKRQSNVGAAIISNFEQAEASIVAMQNAQGQALEEMEVIYDSLQYKANQFKETWVGVSQTLINDEGLKVIVDGLNLLSGGIADVIGQLGLLGTASAVGIGVLGTKFAKSVGRPKMTGFYCAHICSGGDTERAHMRKGALAKPPKLARKCGEFGSFSSGNRKESAAKLRKENVQRV